MADRDVHAETPWMTTTEAAQLLGVKRETLYAYVSRGMLSNQRRSGGRESLFRRSDVAALANHLDRRPSSHRTMRFRTITSGVSQQRDDRLSYRGHDVATLVHESTPEGVACLLLGLDAPPASVPPLPLPAGLEGVPALRRLQVAPGLLAAADPRRGDTSDTVVPQTGWMLTDAMMRLATALNPGAERTDGSGAAAGRLGFDNVRGFDNARGSDGAHAHPTLAGPSETDGSWADALAAGWLARPAHPRESRAVAVALMVLMDHGLTASTVAARVAASTRASVYDGVAAAYAALAGPLHGGASLGATLLLTAVRDGADPAHLLAAHQASSQHVPGFGHLIYAAVDPRYVLLRHELDALAASDAPSAVAMTHALRATDVLHCHRGAETFPNIDLALAALAVGLGWPAWTGSALFTVARTVGCVAHIAEEYAEPPLRWRAQAAPLPS